MIVLLFGFDVLLAMRIITVFSSWLQMRLPGTPLVFVNQAFCHVTGYSKAECIGRNCNFLQVGRS